jgi:hypothetical protein
VPPAEVGSNVDNFNAEAFEKFWDVQQDFTLEEGFNIPWLWSKRMWNEIGGYDEAYDPFASNSDSDLLHRIKIAGLKPLLVRRAAVFHFVATSGWQVGTDNWNKNFQHFIDKFGFTRGDGAGQWHGARLLDIPEDKLVYRENYERYGKI